MLLLVGGALPLLRWLTLLVIGGAFLIVDSSWQS